MWGGHEREQERNVKIKVRSRAKCWEESRAEWRADAEGGVGDARGEEAVEVGVALDEDGRRASSTTDGRRAAAAVEARGDVTAAPGADAGGAEEASRTAGGAGEMVAAGPGREGGGRRMNGAWEEAPSVRGWEEEGGKRTPLERKTAGRC